MDSSVGPAAQWNEPGDAAGNGRAARPAGAGDGISLLALASVFLRHHRLIVGLGVAGVLVAVVTTLILPRHYTASGAFVAQSLQSSSRLASTAAQLGIALPIGDGSRSPQFFADLLTARSLVAQVVDTRYEVNTDSGRVTATLTELEPSKDEPMPFRRDAAIRAWTRRINARVDQGTGIITFGVRASDAELANLVARRLLFLVDSFNVRARQEQAGAERRFAAERLAATRSDLRAAEERVREFLQRNRGDFRGSPPLALEYERLQRDVTMRQQLFTNLQQSLEQARLDELRDIPLILVISEPERPVRPDSRGVPKFAVVGLFGGLAIGIVVALAVEYMRRMREEQPDELEQFVTLRQEAARDLLRPWRLVTRRMARRDRGA